MKDDDTTLPDERDFVLKIQVGFIFPMKIKMDGDKPNDEDLTTKAQQLADALAERVNTGDVKPTVVSILEGEAMSVETFEQMKDHARQQAAALAQVLQAFSGAGGEGPLPDGHDQEGNAEDQEDEVQPVEESTVIEPSPEAFRVPGSRNLN